MAGPYLMVHRKTGTVLRGYQLGQATPEEVSAANGRLRERGSQYQLLPASVVQRRPAAATPAAVLTAT